jgi:glycosyltransferase involved in cell wall biosynthesis
MRVGVFLERDIPETGGGYTFTSTIIQSLIQLAPECKHEFIIFGYTPEPPSMLRESSCLRYVPLVDADREPLIHKVIYHFWQLVCARSYPSMPLYIDTWYEKILFKALRSLKLDIDLLWNLSPGTPTLRIPFIATVWDLAHRITPYFPEVVSIGRFDNWQGRDLSYIHTLPRSVYTFTGTAVGKAEIERFYQVPSARIKVLGLPTPEFALADLPTSDVLAKYRLEPGYLFYPAQFWAHKNHINLLLALKLLRDRHGISLTLVLSGSDKGNRQFVESTVAELGLADRVRFMGFIPQSDIAQLYRHALALVFVSFIGPDNLPPLEAFALGCPAIVSKDAGAIEQLGDAAFLVDRQNPADIAEAIKSVWTSPELRQQLIDRGYRRSRLWTSKDYVRSVFDILDEFESTRRSWSSGI